MHTIQITLYDFFRKDLKIEDKRVKEVVEAIEQTINYEVAERLKEHSNSTATKIDIRGLESDIKQVELKIEQLRSESYKTIFWAALLQVLAVLGGLIAIIKFMLNK